MTEVKDSISSLNKKLSGVRVFKKILSCKIELKLVLFCYIKVY